MHYSLVVSLMLMKSLAIMPTIMNVATNLLLFFEIVAKIAGIVFAHLFFDFEGVIE